MKSNARYLGLQERLHKPPYPLVVNEQGSTVYFQPQKHELPTEDLHALLRDCASNKYLARFLTHLRTHFKSFGRENYGYLSQFYRIPEEEIDNWMLMLLNAGFLK